MNITITHLSKNNFNDFIALLSLEAKHLSGKDLSNDIKERLKHDAFCSPPKYQAYLACQNNTVVGFVITVMMYGTFAAKSRMFIEDLCIKKEYQNQGIAQALLDYCVDKASKQGCSSVDGCVLDWNKAAKKLLIKMNGSKLNWDYYRRECK